MKILLTGIILTFCLLNLVAQEANKIEAESKITSVVVYPDRAQVTRSTTFEVDKGSFEITFKDLPVRIFDNSTQAKLSGAATAKITSIETKSTYVEQTKADVVKKLQDEIQKLKDEERALNDDLAILDQTEAFLNSLKAAFSEKTSKEMLGAKVDMEGIENLMKLIRDTASENAAKRREIDVKKRELNDKLRVLHNELAQLQSMRALVYKNITVNIDAEQEETITLDISYVIPGATWRPVYDIRLSKDAKEAEITYQGIVINSTGEEWNGIELTLSTAKPALAGRPPELHAKAVDFKEFQDPLEKEEYKSLQKRGKGFAMKEALFDKPLAEQYSLAEIATGLTAVFFKIKKLEHIPSDSQPHKTVVAIERFSVELEYGIAPEIAQFAYLKSIISNKDLPLLPGEMNIFLDQDFVGTAPLNPVAPNEKFNTYLGVDEGIKVERKEVKNEKGTSGGFLSATKNRITYGYKTTITNFKKQPAKINVIERVPLSRNEAIEIVIEDQTTREYTKNEQGILRWVIDLNAGEKKEVNLEYSIIYPRDKEIILHELVGPFHPFYPAEKAK